MLLRAPDESTTRHLERAAEDILGLLGPGIELQELVADIEAAGTVTLRARYRLGAATGVSDGHGENLVEAHARLREAIVVDRIGLGLRLLT
jgi:hypothetical protein